MFARLGRWCHDHRWAVIGAWVAVFVLGSALSQALGTETRTEFTLPDVESRRGVDILSERFGGQGAGESGSVVFRTDQGVDDPEVRSAMTEFFEGIAEIEGVARVSSPYDDGNESQISSQGDDDGKIAYATVELDEGIPFEDVQAIVDAMNDIRPSVDGLQIELGGAIFAEFEPPSSELLGVAFAIIILILAFGSVLAMGLPVGTALAGIGVGTMLVGLLSNVVTVPDFATVLGVMIGLGVGIDYALFIVTRFRENVHAGHPAAESVTIAIDTAGRAVAFAGITVVISLLGMLVMGIGFITGLAIGAATVVAVAMIAALTLLPALLGFVESRIELTRWRGLIAAAVVAIGLVGAGLGATALLLVAVPIAVVVMIAGLFVPSLKAEVKRRPRPALRDTVAYRWSRLVQHHPWPAAIVGLVVLVVLALPVLGLRLGFSDEGNYAENTTTRKAYDMLSEGFGPGFNGPLLIVTEVPDGATQSDLDAVSDALADAEGVAFASPAIQNEDGTAALWRVVPTTAPQDAATTDLVKRLRSDVLPAATDGTDLDVAVAGAVAIQVDFSDYLAGRLPYFFGAVLTLSFLLLLVVFRSVLVPVKAVVMNLLSIGAAYGIVVAIFQWGWGLSLLGLDGGPIEPFVPMMLFAILFGLSMDYEVFLLSRIKEEWDRTGDSHTSVADGLALTARVITAAAAIMVVVFGSFLLENDRVVRLFGLGLAVAVLLDATVVRMLLVPATMELLGDRNWWLPRWLDRILPRIEVEGHVEPSGGAAVPAGHEELEEADVSR